MEETNETTPGSRRRIIADLIDQGEIDLHSDERGVSPRPSAPFAIVPIGLTVIAALAPTSAQQPVEMTQNLGQQLLESVKALEAHHVIDQIAVVLAQTEALATGDIDTAVDANGSPSLVITETRQYRLSTNGSEPAETADRAFAVLAPQLQVSYSEQFVSADEIKDALDYLREMFRALIDTLTDPKKLAPILADAAIVTPGVYICWEAVKKIKQFAERKDNRPARQVASKCSKLLSYFDQVPKSRVGEISIATGLETTEILCLLRLMCFVHQPSCFWQAPLRRTGRRRAGRK